MLDMSDVLENLRKKKKIALAEVARIDGAIALLEGKTPITIGAGKTAKRGRPAGRKVSVETRRRMTLAQRRRRAREHAKAK